MRRYLAQHLGVKEGDIGEYIIVLSNGFVGDKPRLIDGFIIRSSTSMGTSPNDNPNFMAYIALYIKGSHNYQSLHNVVDKYIKESLEDTINYFYDLKGDDKCYRYWFENAPKIRAGLELIYSRLLYNVVIKNQRLSHFKNLRGLEVSINEYIDAGQKAIEKIHTPEDVRKLIYVPITDFRRLLAWIIKYYCITKNVEDKTMKALLEAIKHVGASLVSYLIPRCFDGCYGCILSKDCESQNPLMLEWLVSKHMGILIAENLKMNKCDENKAAD